MPEPKRARAEAALDDVSDHLGVVLQRADELLVQWSAFGAAVRGQVDREAAAIGDAVAGAVDTAVARATASGIDRTITEQVGSRLTALAAEIARLEARTRAAAHAVADERKGDRRLLWIVIGGIVLANALLVALLLRRPVAVPAPAEPTKVELVSPPGAQSAPESAPAAAAGSADELQADAPSSNELPVPAPGKEPAAKSEPAAPGKAQAAKPEPAAPGSRRPGGAGAAGAGTAGAAASAGSAGSAAESIAPALAPSAMAAGARAPGAPAAGAKAAPAAKLPPRVPPSKK